MIRFILVMRIGFCVMLFLIAGRIGSASDLAIKAAGGWLCPEGAAPESHSYATTSRDENGFERPLTAYELHCVDARGAVVMKDPILYASIWIGIAAILGMIVTGSLSFVFAVPGGMLVTKLLNRLRPTRAG
jgi:hypothetical protein